MKKAIIFDLDNTIYPVSSIGDELFKPLFEKLKSSGKLDDQLEDIRKDVMRIPFQAVAEQYNFDQELTDECMELLKELEYKKPIAAFDDFEEIKEMKADLFLVTTGFMKMQQSKVESLQLDKDFKEIFIIDPTHSDKEKKDIFKEIMDKYNYQPQEVLVVGDDPDSEIKGAISLEIDAVIYDKNNTINTNTETPKISDYKQLRQFL